MRTTAIVTLLAILFSLPALACPKGQGSWILSSGEVICRECPVRETIPNGKALKMPKGCLAPLAGALLDIDDYDQLKNERQYALELEAWRLELGPTLDTLLVKVQDSTSKLEDAARYNMELQIALTDTRAKFKASERSFWIVTLASASVALVLSTSLWVSYTAR